MRMSFSRKILAGLLGGIAVGLVFGELISPIKVVADGFVKLLQMTVLPYVTISLIAGLGRLNPNDAKRLGLGVGAVLIGLWAIALVFACLPSLALPEIESASFFSTTLIERRPPFNFIDLYIPANPFFSLANNIVPAVVLFSVVLGAALIGIQRKQVILDVLEVASATIARVTRFVVRFTPYGLFAIAAHAAGTLNLEQIERIQIYLVSYICVSLLVSLWVLPGLVSALTPIDAREVLGATRDGLITAFMAGDLFIVLPILMDGSKSILERHFLNGQNAKELPEIIVPASFNFPHTGKLLSLSFILFAGWFSGAAVSLANYPRLAVTGLFTLFGSTNAAIPFLLDLFRIPADTFQLFLATGIVNARFGTLLAAVHTVTVGLLGSAAVAGAIQFSPPRLLRYLATTAALVALTVFGLRTAFDSVLKPRYAGADLVSRLHSLYPQEKSTVVKDNAANNTSQMAGGVLAGIRNRGVMRVGFVGGRLPFAFLDRNGELIGFDVEMAHLLARDMGVRLEFVELDPATPAEVLSRGGCDIVMTGVPVTPAGAEQMLFSVSYLDETLSFIVLDHLREQFSSWGRIRALGPVRIGIPNVPYYIDKIQRRLPQVKLEPIPPQNLSSLDDTLGVEALVFPAERGSILTLLNPKFTVVVPEPDLVKIPLAYAIAHGDQRWASFVNSWIELKRKDGTIDALYRYWIFGENLVERRPRWSVLRDVLRWVD
jgi:Na+/H+-dicarboxylate symporter/ABC-type amino acid transport substrate-binding protein